MLDRSKTTNVDWKTQGIKVVKSVKRSCDTPDTKGMNRQVALSGTRSGSKALWAGTELHQARHRPPVPITTATSKASSTSSAATR